MDNFSDEAVVSAAREAESRGHAATLLKEQLKPYFSKVASAYIAQWTEADTSPEQGAFIHRQLQVLKDLETAIQNDIDDGLRGRHALAQLRATEQ